MAEAVGEDPVAGVVAAWALDVEVGGLAAGLQVLSALRAEGVEDPKFGVIARGCLEHGVEFDYARAYDVPLAHGVAGGREEAIDEVGDVDVCEELQRW